MREIKVEQKDGKYILTTEYLEKLEFTNLRDLIGELMHYKSDIYQKRRIQELLRFYGSKLER